MIRELDDVTRARLRRQRLVEGTVWALGLALTLAGVLLLCSGLVRTWWIGLPLLIVGLILFLRGVAMQRRYREAVVEALGLDVHAFRRYMAGDPEALEGLHHEEGEGEEGATSPRDE